MFMHERVAMAFNQPMTKLCFFILFVVQNFGTGVHSGDYADVE